MANWSVWFWAAGVLVVLEMFTGTFYLLMIGIGLACGGLAQLAGAGSSAQTVIAGLMSLVTIYALRRSKFGKTHKTEAARDRNVNLDIGQALDVQDWETDGANHFKARVMYRGAMWDVDLAHDAVAKPGRFVIREVRGSRLLVGNE